LRGRVLRYALRRVRLRVLLLGMSPLDVTGSGVEPRPSIHEVPRRGVLGSTIAGSCIAPVLMRQNPAMGTSF